MTLLKASLESALRNVEITAHEKALLHDCATVRWADAGVELTGTGGYIGDGSIAILIKGCLRITRRISTSKAMPGAIEQSIQIAAVDRPVLVPPPHPCLRIRSETHIELMEFDETNCSLMLGTCRAFRALVFAAANAGVTQLTDQDIPSGQDLREQSSPSIPPNMLH